MSKALLRMEKVARLMEHDLGEAPILGRHHRAVLTALRGRRDDVAAWLIAAYGREPNYP